MTKNSKTLRIVMIATLSLSSVWLAGCTVYRTRIFEQINKVQFESWSIEASLGAYMKTSQAVKDKHFFGSSISLSTYPENRETVYNIQIQNMAFKSGKCPGTTELIIGETTTKEILRPSKNPRAYITTNYPFYIEPKVQNVCAIVFVDFIPKDGSETISKNFEIDMKRKESSTIGPVLG